MTVEISCLERAGCVTGFIRWGNFWFITPEVIAKPAGFIGNTGVPPIHDNLTADFFGECGSKLPLSARELAPAARKVVMKCGGKLPHLYGNRYVSI